MFAWFLAVFALMVVDLRCPPLRVTCGAPHILVPVIPGGFGLYYVGYVGDPSMFRDHFLHSSVHLNFDFEVDVDLGVVGEGENAF